MSQSVYTTQEYIQRLVALIAAEYAPDDGEAPAHIRLYKNDANPDANMSLLTFEEADFTGYVPVDLSMTAPTMNDQGLIVTKSNICNFASAAGVDPQTIYGVYIVDNGGARVLAAQRFDTPQQMGGVYPQAVTGVWRMSEPLTTMGWIDVEN